MMVTQDKKNRLRSLDSGTPWMRGFRLALMACVGLAFPACRTPDAAASADAEETPRVESSAGDSAITEKGSVGEEPAGDPTAAALLSGLDASSGDDPSSGASPGADTSGGRDARKVPGAGAEADRVRASRDAEAERLLAELARSSAEPGRPRDEPREGEGVDELDWARRVLDRVNARDLRGPSPTPGPALASTGNGGSGSGDSSGTGTGVEVATLRGGQDAPPAAPEAPARPVGRITFHTLWHKTAAEALEFISTTRPEWVDSGHIAPVDGRARSLVIFGETDTPEDALTAKIITLIDQFDELDLTLERRIIKPRWVQVNIAMDALVMSGLANVWASADSKDVLAWQENGKNRSIARDTRSYVDQGLIKGGVAPIAPPPKVPFVYDMPREDPFDTPHVNTASGAGQLSMTFNKTSSTEDRGGMMAVGTTEDLERIQAFVDSIDVPARRIMVEVQLIELEANKLQDLGFDSLQFGSGHHIANLSLPLPGEQIVQPGIGPDARRDPEQFVPDVVSEGLSFFFDDTSFDLQGRFLTSLHALVREGEAQVKARPKILTLDDRTSVLHLGRDVPTFISTSVTRDTQNGNLVNSVNAVGTIYAGITLNIRPRVTGGEEDEVAIQIEVLDNQIVGRQRVFEEDLAGIPEVVRRQYIGQARCKNHRPVILGGLIQEQDVETVNKIPLLADIPYLGYLFRRTTTTHRRNEVIIIVTPHILTESGYDPVGAPKESVHFDTFDSVLFNDRHILKGGDVLGLDPISRQPARGPEGEPFSREEVVDLTYLNIVRSRELVSKLNMLETYLGPEINELNWFQRRWPESSVATWDAKDQELYFRVAAVCIENLKQMNPDLDFDDLTIPRREIVLPTSPYHLSLSYDRVKRVQALGLEHVFRGGETLGSEHVALLREAASHRLSAFADFLARQPRDGSEEKVGRVAKEHGELLSELRHVYEGAGGDPKKIDRLPYPEVFRKLEEARIGFGELAAYFQAGLEQRYRLAPLEVGVLRVDLRIFLESSVTLRQRADRLRELEQKWNRTQKDSEEL